MATKLPVFFTILLTINIDAMDLSKSLNEKNGQITDQNLDQEIQDNVDSSIKNNDIVRMNYNLYVCIQNDSHLSNTKRLLERDANPNVILYPFKRSGLQRAQENGAFKTVELLLKWSGNPFLPTTSGNTLLYSICDTIEHFNKNGEEKRQFVKKQIKIAQLVLELGADPNEKDQKGITLLFKLIHPPKCALPLIELLVRFGADPTLKDENGHNALFFYANVRRYHASSRGIEYIKDLLEGKVLVKMKKLR